MRKQPTARTIVVGVFLAAALLATPARAADMAVKAAPPPPPAAPVWSWTGAYAGVNIGWGRNSGSDPVTYFAPGTGFIGTTNGFDTKGVFGGGQVGYNYQINYLLLGVEGDFQGANFDGRTNVTVASNGGPLGVVASQLVSWVSTVRGRVGFV